MEELLVGLDSNMLLILGFVMLGIVVVFIVAKLIKVAVIAAVLCLVVFLGVPYLEKLQSVVSFDTETKSITVQAEEGAYTVDLDSLKSVKINDGKVEFEDGSGKVKSLKIPKYAVILVEQYLEKNNIEIKQ